MKVKIISILMIALLIATTLPAIGVTIKQISNENPLLLLNGEVDQEQTTNCNYGMTLTLPLKMAQSFKPTKESLTYVELWLFRQGNPPENTKIFVSVRSAPDGEVLTEKSILGVDEEIPLWGKWVLFDFDDITTTPGETYYIVCYATNGYAGNRYCWYYDINDKYDRGEAWYSDDYGTTWITLWEWHGYSQEWYEPDFCFKTYSKKSKEKTFNTLFQQFLESHPNMFPILQKFLL
jgi:hypothetical protein